MKFMTKFYIGVIFLLISCSNNQKYFIVNEYGEKVPISTNEYNSYVHNEITFDTIQKDSICIRFLREYSKFWKQDSLGKNGFRKIAAEKVIKKCNKCELDSSDVYNLLGNPYQFGSSNLGYNLYYPLTPPKDGHGFEEILVKIDGKTLKVTTIKFSYNH